MAIGYLNVAHISRGEGKSAVGAAAYAARTRLIDERTGEVFDYSRKSGDLIASGLFIPKGAPERLRDRAALWNEAEQAEKRKDSRTARRMIIALPHELTPVQRQQLLTDFIRSEFMRKGLAVDMNIHAPDAKGDDRNEHAHLLITTRFIGADGFDKKDRESNERAALTAWQNRWTIMANRQLERYGHAPTVSFKTAEGQMPQIHLGQAASALERKGVKTRAGDALREIVNDNDARRVANEQKRTVGKEFDYAAGRAFAREVVSQPPPAQRTPVQQPQDWTAGKLFARDEIKPPSRAASNDNRPETIDRDAEAARSQDAIDSAGIAYVEQRRQQLRQTQGTERATYEGHREEMTARHSATWGEAVHRHAVEMAEAYSVAPASYQPGTMEDAGQAAATGFSAVFGFLSSIMGGITGSTRRRAGRDSQSKPAKRDTERREQEKRDQHRQEISAIMEQQSHERESFERRHTAMLQDQQRAREHFEQNYADPSAMQQAFDIHGRQTGDSYAAELGRMAARKEARQERERGGPELNV